MSLKRVPATLCRRLAAGWKAGVAAFVSIGTVGGTLASIYAVTGGVLDIDTRGAIVIIAACVVLSIIVAFARGRLKALPDSIIDEMSAESPYACDYCSKEHLNQACDMTKPYYGDEYVDGRVANHWREKNPKAFVEITNKDGELCACFGILALTDSFCEQFMAGRVADTQMEPDCIVTADNAKKSSILYISGVVVRDPSTYRGSKRAVVMVWAMVKYLKEVYGTRKTRTLIAIAANKESERLMKNLGFKLHQEASRRVDRCGLYTYSFSRQSIEDLLCRVGDMSPMCNCRF